MIQIHLSALFHWQSLACPEPGANAACVTIAKSSESLSCRQAQLSSHSMYETRLKGSVLRMLACVRER